MRTIFLIRHAEKPPDRRPKHPGRETQKRPARKRQTNGVDKSGTPDKEALTVPGWQRAGALAVFFGSKKGLPAPRRIYASAPGKAKVAPTVKVGSSSKRPTLTVSPLAAKLKLSIIAKFAKGQEHDLAAEVTGWKGTTLVSWQHEPIPEIAETILGSAKGVPARWPGNRYDVVWRFVRRGKGGRWKFDQVCQNLLFGDKPDPIPLKPKAHRKRARPQPPR